MKKSELKNVKHLYVEFSKMLFNNDMPDVKDMDFNIHGIERAIGYSMRRQEGESGKPYVIAFCKYYKFSEKLFLETLIHEMIHIWQMYKVSEARYSICSHEIAHDRVFRSKMATINLLLKRNGYDVIIKEVCEEDILIDDNVKTNEYYICYVTFDGKDLMFKTTEKSFKKVTDEFIEHNKTHNNISSMFAFKTTDPDFKCMKSIRKMQSHVYPAKFLDKFDNKNKIVLI